MKVTTSSLDLTTKGISQMAVKAVNKNDIGELIDDTTTRRVLKDQ